MQTVPKDAWTSLESLIRSAATDANKLKAIINNIAEISGGQLTTNWNWGFLEQDISSCVFDLRKKVNGRNKKHFDAFMDSLEVLNSIGELSLSKINEFLEDFNIGYHCEKGFNHKVIWSPVENAGAVEAIAEVKKSVKPLSQQACERFESALRQFEDVSLSERARKDAVRSCIDAMEALVKELGGDDEIGEATKNLKDTEDAKGNLLWGPVEIVKDGNGIFNLLHKLYPDVRHGTQDVATAEMTMEEAEYFVGRITTFVKYIVARAKKLGKL